MLDAKIFAEMQEYVTTRSSKPIFLLGAAFAAPLAQESVSECLHTELKNYIKNTRKPTFTQVLFKLIDAKGALDTDIYKRAGLDRRHFSKIRSNPTYHPSKNSAIALALALELPVADTEKLLNAAGYSLSSSGTFDLVIQFCIKKKIYDLQEVNCALDYFGLKPLAGVAN